MDSKHGLTHLRCQNNVCPMRLLRSALLRRNCPNAVSRYISNLSTCTSCRRYLARVVSLGGWCVGEGRRERAGIKGRGNVERSQKKMEWHRGFHDSD